MAEKPLLEAESSYLYEFIFEICGYFSSCGFIACDPAEVFVVARALVAAQGQVNVRALLMNLLVHDEAERAAAGKIFREFTQLYYHKEHLRQAYADKQQRMNGRLERLLAQHAALEAEGFAAVCRGRLEQARALEAAQQDVAHLADCLAGLVYLLSFVVYVQRGEPVSHERLTQEVKISGARAMAFDNYQALLESIKARSRMLQALEGDGGSLEAKQARIAREIERQRGRIKAAEDAFGQTIEKHASVIHRDFFDPETAKNAVHSLYAGEPILQTRFDKLSTKDKAKIYEYIRDNARKFRTRLARRLRGNQRKRLDLPNTIKQSCQTGGVPLRLVYEKPARNKTNLVLILDMSGSCSAASELMLVFMHAMKSAFPGGCQTFAFTNRLFDLAPFFEETDASQVVQAVLAHIPRAGAYSNYYIPFRTLYESHFGVINRDSIVYFIGDARNNKHPTGEDYVKAIARKAKRAYWMNTEPMQKWNKGDSIMAVYARYMDRVGKVETPAELLAFLEEG
ncbi:MAG: VWA domain-containing protein [Peptococcaceae bacterium]|nr:VWA domain-containing protein [Peptococcaceae bacterium]